VRVYLNTAKNPRQTHSKMNFDFEKEQLRQEQHYIEGLSCDSYELMHKKQYNLFSDTVDRDNFNYAPDYFQACVYLGHVWDQFYLSYLYCEDFDEINERLLLLFHLCEKYPRWAHSRLMKQHEWPDWEALKKMDEDELELQVQMECDSKCMKAQ